MKLIANTPGADTARPPIAPAAIGSQRRERLMLVAALVVGCASAPAPTALTPAPAYRCTQVMGVAVTSEWYAAGFEPLVDGRRWQAQAGHGAYLEVWAEPDGAAWQTPVVSPCAEPPDRVLFFAVSWQDLPPAAWDAAFENVVTNLRARHPAVRRVELLTAIRGPGGASCGGLKTTAPAALDDAIARAAARHSTWVHAGPRIALPRCAFFRGNGPYLTPDGNAFVAREVATHYR